MGNSMGGRLRRRRENIVIFENSLSFKWKQYIPLPLQSWTVFKFLFFSAPLCLSVSALKKTNSACSKLNRAYTLLQSIIMQEFLVAILNAEAGRHGHSFTHKSIVSNRSICYSKKLKYTTENTDQATNLSRLICVLCAFCGRKYLKEVFPY